MSRTQLAHVEGVHLDTVLLPTGWRIPCSMPADAKGLMLHHAAICIADLDAEDGSFHGEGFENTGHHGFDYGDLANRLRTAGFTDVTIDDRYQVERDGCTFPLFLATARHPE